MRKKRDSRRFPRDRRVGTQGFSNPHQLFRNRVANDGYVDSILDKIYGVCLVPSIVDVGHRYERGVASHSSYFTRETLRNGVLESGRGVIHLAWKLVNADARLEYEFNLGRNIRLPDNQEPI